MLNQPRWRFSVTYQEVACRALNQAIGRCIRHKHDYGGIILLDRRFGEVRNRENLSCWCATLTLSGLQAHFHVLRSFPRCHVLRLQQSGVWLNNMRKTRLVYLMSRKLRVITTQGKGSDERTLGLQCCPGRPDGLLRPPEG